VAIGGSIGEAFITVSADARRFSGDLSARITPALSRIGGMVGDALKVSLKTAGLAAGTVAVAAIGETVSGGLKRLSGLDTAKARLKGIGVEGRALDGVMQQIISSVEGTSVSLDGAASAAALLMTSGVKAGDELDDALAGLINTTAATGASIDEITQIWQKMAATGKVGTEQLNQLAERGVSGLAALAAEFGITQEQAQEMVSAGEVSFEDLNRAMKNNLGDMAEAVASSMSGMLANFRTGFAMIGAGALEPFFDAFKIGLAPMVELMYDLAAATTEAAAPLSGKLTPAAEAFAAAVEKVDVSAAFDRVTSSISNLKGLLIPLAGAALGAIGPLVSGVPVLGSLLQGLTGPVGIVLSLMGLMVAKSEPLRNALGGAFENIMDTLVSLSPVFEAASRLVEVLAASMGDVLASAINTLVPPMLNLVEAAGPLLTTAINLLADGLAAITPYMSTLVPLILGLVGAMKAWSAVTGIITGLQAGFIAGTYGAAGASYAQGTAAKVAAAGTRIFNAALKANPILKIIGLITLIVSALIYFFTQTETGKAIWDKVWGGIKAVAQTVADWFTGTLLPILQGAWEGIQAAAAAVADWYQANLAPVFEAVGELISAVFERAAQIIGPIFEGIKSDASAFGEALSVVWGWISERFEAAWTTVQAIWDTVGQPIIDVMTAAWNILVSALSTVWENIKVVIETALSVIQNIIQAITAAIQGDWSGAWNHIKAAAQAVWNGIKQVVQNGINFVKTVITNVVNAVKSVWSTAWNVIKTVAANIWNGIKNTISNAINSVRSTITNRVNAIRSTWSSVWNAIRNVASSVWNGIKSVISGAINSVRSTITGRVNSIKSTWSSAWNTMKSLISNVWNGIVSGVRNGINNTMSAVRSIKSRITGFFSGAASWLISAGRNIINGLKNGIQNAIGGAIDAVRNGVSRIRNLLPFSPAKEGPLSGRGYTLYSGQALARDLAKGIESQEGTIAGAARRMAAQVQAPFQGISLTGDIPSMHRSTSTNVTLTAPNGPDRMSLDKQDMDYIADRLAGTLWPAARATRMVEDIASMGKTRMRMGVNG